MIAALRRKLTKAARNMPNLWQGYNLYVNREKLALIDLAFRRVVPGAATFADLGGAWRVDAGYARYAMKNFPVTRGILVDTDVPPAVLRSLEPYAALEVIQDDFAKEAVADRIGKVDILLLFDVLLHQANPDWDVVLERYARHASCFVIYNQQYMRGGSAVRLTDLPYEEYVSLTSDRAEELIRRIYAHPEEIHPVYGKPWKDIHNVTQWGITDAALREVMARCGFTEVYFRNYGMFVGLPAFEEHAFIFVRR